MYIPCIYTVSPSTRLSLVLVPDLVGNRILSNRSHVPSKSGVAVVTRCHAPWHFHVVHCTCFATTHTRAPRHFRVFVPTRRDGKQPDATPLTADPDIVFVFGGVD
jgi:hypothetical protein